MLVIRGMGIFFFKGGEGRQNDNNSNKLLRFIRQTFESKPRARLFLFLTNYRMGLPMSGELYSSMARLREVGIAEMRYGSERGIWELTTKERRCGCEGARERGSEGEGSAKESTG